MNKKIRFSLLTLLVMLCGTVFATKTVYIQPNDWSNDGAVISLNVWGDGQNDWVDLTEVESGILKATFDDGKTMMAILRAKDGYGNKWKSEDGSNVWNQSADITITDGKLYSITGWDNAQIDNGITLSDYSEPTPDTSYKVDFNTTISTSSHDFVIGSNWGHIVDFLEYDYYGTEYSYVTYGYSSNGGKNETGALYAYSQNLSASYGVSASKTAYDLLVTPLINGQISIDVKAMNYSDASLQVYALTNNGKEKGELIKEFVLSDLSTDDYTTVTFTLTEEQKVGLRLNRVYVDNFNAESVTIIPEPKLTITSVKKATNDNTVYYEQQADGSLLVQMYVNLQNNGEVDFVAGATENYTLSVLQDYYGTKAGPFGTFAIPVNLAKGETSEDILVSVSVPAESVASLNTWGNWYVIENVTSTQSSSSVWASWIAYEPKFVFRAAESTATSSITAAEAWGTITESFTKNFEIANTGTAPLTIKSITLPEGFTSDNAPVAEFTLAKGETQTLNITQDATVTGTFSGTLTIVYLDKNAAEQTYTLAFSATVIGANTWTADFNNSTSTVIYPAGSIAEGGINKDYQYISSGNYNNWLVGRTGGSYATENNKFITPKLHANANDKLAYDVKAGYSSTNEYFVKVYVSSDRQNWGDPVAYYTYSTDTNKGSEGVGSAFTTKTLTFDEAGDYYVAFALYGTTSAIDNLVGLEKVDVAHDLYIKSVNWPDASIKSGASQTKPSVEVIPLTDETADAYTVKYVCGETVLAEGTPVALTASASSSKTFSFSWTPNVENTTVYENTKVVFDFGGGVTFETEPFNLTVTNEPIFHFVSSIPSSKWYEPTDVSTPIAFGKTNAADSKTFYVYNWGSAPLTVNSISLPEGFTTSVDFPIVVPAFDENNLSAAAQALDITFSAAESGTFGGDMVITYSGDQTFTLAISGTKLDPTKFYATFGTSSAASNYPAGSLAQANISITTPTTNNGALNSSSSTKNLFITPKLTTTGENVQFDAKVRSSYYAGSVKVYSVTNNVAAAETTTDAEFEALNPTLLGEFTIGTDVSNFTTYSVEAPAGEYYLAFKIADVQVDEIYGLTPVAVAHDWKIASSNVPAEAMQNVASTATVNILNLGVADEAAEDITVTAYVDNKAVATAQGVAIPMNHKLSDAGTQLSVSYLSPKAGTFPVYVEVKAGDYSVATDPVDVTFTEEVFVNDAIEIGYAPQSQTSSYSYAPIDFFNFEQARTSDIVYTAKQLTDFGLKAGDKITTLAFKGTLSSAKTMTKSSLNAWVGLKTGDITFGSPDKSEMMEVTVYNAGEMAFVAGTNMVTINLPETIIYDGSSDLRIYLEGGGNSEYVGLNFSYDTDYSNMKWSNNASMKYNPLLYVTVDAAPATLSGTVKTSGREAIEGATVTLKAANGVEYSGTTDAEGNYSINVIQAGLDFTATVEAENYLKKEFAYNLGGESKTLNTTLYKSYGIVGSFPGFDWDNDKVMTQSTENPNEFTYVIEDVELVAGTEYEFKLRADGIWKADDNDGYQLPSVGNKKYTPAKSGLYTLTFTANVADHSLEMDAQKQPNTYTATFTTNTGWEEVYAYAWTGDGEGKVEFLGELPGTKLTATEGVYNVEFKAEDAPAYIRFSNGAGAQTDALEFVEGKAYAYNTQTYTATFTTVKNWEKVYAYAWTGEGDNAVEFLDEWPGTELTKNAETGLYEVSIVAVAAPEKIIFNNGTGAQTGDLDFVNGEAYELGDSELMAEARTKAADAEAVAVGKLLDAIAYVDKTGDESNLKAAIDKFKADNADQEEDETAKVATNGWKKFDGSNAGTCATKYAPAIDTYDGRKNVQLAEVYEGNGNRTGTIIYQDITGLTNGKYKVGFYGNAFSTSGRDGFECTMEDGATDVAYVFANEQKNYITARIATSTTVNDFRTFDVEVTNGTIKLGMGKDTEKSTNWHTMQIYQLTWFTTAKEVYAAVKEDMIAEIAAANALKKAHRTKGLDEFNVAIGSAEATLESNMLNIDEFKNEVVKLKEAEEAFKNANCVQKSGIYYVQNVATGLYMAAGNDWGTRGIVNEVGLDITLITNDVNNYVDFDSRVNNNGNHFLGGNLYMDSSKFGWHIEQTGEDMYAIGDGTQFIGVDDKNNLVLQDNPTEWKLVTPEAVREDRLATLSAATVENPVDATFLLQNPNFNRNDQRVSAWEVTFTSGNNKNLNGGNQVNNCAESYHAAFTAMQTISGAPAGIYKLTAQGFYRQDAYEGDAPAAPQFFANEVNGAVPVKTGSENGMSDASASFTNGLYTIEPIEFEVTTDGMMYVGITASTNTQWVVFDNFQLKYYGEMITISEDANYTPVDKFANVTLERTFSSENWNTFVVPFDIDNATLTEKFGNDVQVAEYSDEGINADNVTVHFDKMTSPAITANVPVLLKTTATAPITFSGVQVKAAAEAKKAGEYFDFVGSYKDQEFVTTGNYYLYENKIYKSTSDEGTFIKGTRAYLKAKEAGEARIVNFTIGDEIVTGIKVIDANNNAKENIYNLNGQKVNNVKKGLYIKNGQKVMMK